MSDYSPPTYDTPSNEGSTSADSASLADSASAAKDKATDAAQAGKQAAGEVAQTATNAAKDVAQQTASHAKDLAGKTSQQITEQASVQKSALVDGLRSLVEQLEGMTEHAEKDGIAVELAGKAREQAHSAADWLDGREPSEVLDGIRQLGRERPAAYLAGALAAGVVAGRLTRGVAAVHLEDSGSSDTGTGRHETTDDYASRPSALDTPSALSDRNVGTPSQSGGLYSDSAISTRPTPGTTPGVTR